MAKYWGDVKTIPYSDTVVFRTLSDLNNLKQIENLIPKDKIESVSFEKESVSFIVDSIGSVIFSLMVSEPNELIKFKLEKPPFDIFLSIMLTSKSEKITELALLVEYSLNLFIKGLFEKWMRELIDTLSDALVKLPYDNYYKPQ